MRTVCWTNLQTGLCLNHSRKGNFERRQSSDFCLKLHRIHVMAFHYLSLSLSLTFYRSFSRQFLAPYLFFAVPLFFPITVYPSPRRCWVTSVVKHHYRTKQHINPPWRNMSIDYIYAHIHTRTVILLRKLFRCRLVATAEINRALHPQQEENKINGMFLCPWIYLAVK
jgi:hypothetical protein